MPNTVSDPIITTLGKCMNFEGNDKQVAINNYPVDKRVSCEDMIQAQHKWLKIHHALSLQLFLNRLTNQVKVITEYLLLNELFTMLIH